MCCTDADLCLERWGRSDAPEDRSTTAGVSVAGEGSGERKQLQFYPCETTTFSPLPQGSGEQRARLIL